MTAEPYDVSPRIRAYLDRIQYAGSVDASLATLTRLQERHVLAVPYENLDIINGTPLSLELTDLYDKIVLRRRGGYCFELNALYGWLLRELGFTVTDLFSRFWRDVPVTPPQRRHQILVVQLEDHRYLCDVGVGGVAPRQPIRLTEGLNQQQGDEIYRLMRDETYGWLLQERKDEQWRLIYSFTEEPQFPTDYIMASYWCENSPDSNFNKVPIAAIRTPEGRHSLTGKEFRTFTDSDATIYTAQTQEEFTSALRTYFGIEIAASTRQFD
ncbi:arylamine N-acetyltransferase family protein [Cohnella herbarum]|uniref:Arylamine N-acetyltransferase n=1 Tax=Cohnella herbarum TaxID=2728023 RepID=A0A7Z2ZL39_9BACL|nr:arylamine N-acetyltransferase [Cohnella herbarum]QJD82702.1 arylamine N-acetyltransferase [Cohnella herbarum]